MKGEAMGNSILRRIIPSRLEEVGPVCRDMKDLLISKGLEHLCFTIDLLTRELVNNAVLHGNSGDETKKVFITLRLGRKWIILRVADEGPGFKWQRALKKQPDEMDTSGRGLSIGSIYAERMAFNRSGNRITLWINRLKKEE